MRKSTTSPCHVKVRRRYLGWWKGWKTGWSCGGWTWLWLNTSTYIYIFTYTYDMYIFVKNICNYHQYTPLNIIMTMMPGCPSDCCWEWCKWLFSPCKDWQAWCQVLSSSEQETWAVSHSLVLIEFGASIMAYNGNGPKSLINQPPRELFRLKCPLWPKKH